MGIEDFSKCVLGVVLLLVLVERGVESQNLSEYYGNSCDFESTMKDSSAHVKECNTNVQETTEEFLYVVLVCIDGTCQCPDVFSIKGKPLNATGYEWNKERAQCLLSADSVCGNLTENMCADGPCVDGTCLKPNNKTLPNHGFRLVERKIFPCINFSFLPVMVIINLII